jgi:RHS repeat-associated protein
MAKHLIKICLFLIIGGTQFLNAHEDTDHIAPKQEQTEQWLYVQGYPYFGTAEESCLDLLSKKAGNWELTSIEMPDETGTNAAYCWGKELTYGRTSLFVIHHSVSDLSFCHKNEFPVEEDVDGDGKVDHCHAHPVIPQSCDSIVANTNVINGEKKYNFTNDLTVGNGDFPITYTRHYRTQPAETIELMSQMTEVGSSNNLKSITQSDAVNGSKLITVSSASTLLKKPEGAKYITNNFDKSIIKYDELNVYLRNPSGIDIKVSTASENNHFSGGVLRTLATGWEVITKKGIREEYSLNGLLIMREDTSGSWQKLEHDSSGNLIRVFNDQGYDIDFSYNTQGLIEYIEKPDGNKISYEYDEIGRQVSVTTSSDNVTEYYLYEYTEQPYLLTAIIDGNGVRYVEWDYDDQSRAISRKYVGQTDVLQISYNSDSQVSVTNGNGHVRTIDFSPILGNLTKVVGKSCSTENINGVVTFSGINPAIKTDERGIKTYKSFVANTQKLEKVIEAYGTEQQRTTEFRYDPVYAKVSAIDYPNGLTVNYSYGLNGRIETYSESGASIETRLTTYHYNENNLLASIDGPRTDVNDNTYFEYDSRRRLVKVTNALGHTTEFLAFDANGHVTQIKDPNGALTELLYNSRGQLLQLKSGESATQYTYDKVGQLLNVTLSSGSQMTYVYDDARRLISISDNLNNRIEYSLDAEGNVTQKTIQDSEGALHQTQSFVYDQVNRLHKTINANNATWENKYDVEGQLVKTVNPKGDEQQFGFDELKRLTEQTDPLGGVIKTDTNVTDTVTTVTDPTNKSTQYKYNVVGEITQLISQDSGITNYTYDTAGNLITKTDARNSIVTYTYDALNRILTQSYNDPSENIVFGYDDRSSDNLGVGRLTSVSDQSGKTDYFYNIFGQVSKETKMIANQSYVTHYQFNEHGQLISMTYPSGRTLKYSFDQTGRIVGLISEYQGTTKTLASGIQYLPFGPMTDLTYGNNHQLKQQFDLDYRLTSKTVTGISLLEYAYDLTNNITAISDSIDANSTQNFVYDPLARLTNATGNYGLFEYTYDAVGNRLTKTENGTLIDYSAVEEVEQPATAEKLVANAVELTATWSTRANVHRNDVGKAFYYYCPPNGTAKGIWGTDIYLDYSAICVAAVHQGVITLQDGGSIKIAIKGEQTSFAGSNQNGIVSSNYGAYAGSFTVEPVPSDIQFVNSISWSQSASTIKLHLGKKRTYECPAGGTPKSIWGSSYYLSDSKICSAAVHFGLITFADGGQFNLLVTPDQGSYVGTTQNGITSRSYGAYNGSYQLSALETTSSSQPLPTNPLVPMFTFDAMGNALTKNDLTFTYNQQGRLKSATKENMNASYVYSFKGERTVKQVNGVSTHFIYDLQGQLVAEADSNGVIQNEYIYLNGQRLASISNNTLYYVHTDHLGTPIALTDDAGTVRWKASYTPFGNATVEVNTVENNIRFPGQYFDAETGLHYNYFRDYDPEIGRYIQSDPIGLAGGINTYGYVGGNPVMYSDPYGLEAATTFALWEIWALRGLGGLACAVPAPGARIVGVGLISLTLAGDTPNSRALPGEGLAPPGTCSDGYYDYLKQQKEFACSQPRSCSARAQGSCDDILDKLNMNNACVKARDNVMKKCFKGGDQRHQLERQSARRGVSNCIAQAATNSCRGF